MDGLLEDEDNAQDLFADSTYVGKKQNEIIDKYGLVNKVHEKGCRSNPLTDEQKANNKIKSKTRARVEHIFDIYSIKGQLIQTVVPNAEKVTLNIEQFDAGIYFINAYTDSEVI